MPLAPWSKFQHLLLLSLQFFTSTSLSLLFDFSASVFSYLSFHLFVFPTLCVLSSSWEIRKFPPETSAFSEQYSWVFFFLDNFRPPFGWFFRRTCIGLCVHFLYISSILGELVLVFLWESEKYILAEFWFQPVLTKTVTWEREDRPPQQNRFDHVSFQFSGWIGRFALFIDF